MTFALQYWIVLLGGPGSGKGRIIANLRSMFGVRLISIESLIFHYLPKKVQHTMKVSTTKEMANLIRNDPSQISLEWILRLLQHQIENDPNQIFVVDLIPNLRWLVRNDNLVKECTKEMKAFEEKVPLIYQHLHTSYIMNFLTVCSFFSSTRYLSHSLFT